MPIYAYRCDSCGHQQDVLQKMSDARLVDCPACGKPTYQKQVTAAGFQLKGSGWYVTDFRDTGKKELAKSGGDGATADASAPAKEATTPADNGKPAPAASPAAAPATTTAASSPSSTPANSPPSADAT